MGVSDEKWISLTLNIPFCFVHQNEVLIRQKTNKNTLSTYKLIEHPKEITHSAITKETF